MLLSLREKETASNGDIISGEWVHADVYCVFEYDPWTGDGGGGEDDGGNNDPWEDPWGDPWGDGTGGGTGGGNGGDGGESGDNGEPTSTQFTPSNMPAPDPLTDPINCNELRDLHGEADQNLNDFINANDGLTKDMITRQRPDNSITRWHSQPGGPTIRYIRDPLNPDIIIDLRHMLVIGEYGRVVGESLEVAQWITLQESGINDQDYYSNQLGYDFYAEYGTAIQFNPTAFVDYLITFLNDPTNRAPLTNPTIINTRCP